MHIVIVIHYHCTYLLNYRVYTVSRYRSRATSFNTVIEDVEAELHSLDNVSLECRSMPGEQEDDVYRSDVVTR